MQDFTKACAKFEEFLQNYKIDIDGFHPHFKKAFWEMVKNGGKRFRPNLTLAIVQALNPLLVKNAFLPCLAIECLHTYSLIHDDLPCMDNADLRRSHPTLHKSYDETTAVLVGDGLNTFAFFLLAQASLSAESKVTLINELAKNGGIDGMIIGQAMDCFFENQKLELEQLKIIHLNKTAKLIATSLKFGAIIANASDELTKNLWDFGLELGVFFQIRDDVIDAVLDSSTAGKTTQNDGTKNSYVNLLGLSRAKEMLKDYQASIINKMQIFPDSIKQNLESLLGAFFKEL